MMTRMKHVVAVEVGGLGVRRRCRPGRRTQLLWFLAFSLAIGLPLAPALAGDGCGGAGQRACCLLEGEACDSGLIQIVGCRNGSGLSWDDCGCWGLTCGLCARSSGWCYRPTACGGDGQRACCAIDAYDFGDCRGDLIPETGCIGDLACRCTGGIGWSTSTCRARDCGHAGERACCVGERSTACDCGTREVADLDCGPYDDCGGCSTSWCEANTPCGGAGQRACCIGRERECNGGQACDADLEEKSFCGTDGRPSCGHCSTSWCAEITPCGGEGQRACCWGEDTSIGACEEGLIQSGDCEDEKSLAECVCPGIGRAWGVCKGLECGGVGQRACCLRERIPACDEGLVQDTDPSCEDAPPPGGCDCTVGSAKSWGICGELKGIGDGCTLLGADRCAGGLMCMPTPVVDDLEDVENLETSEDEWAFERTCVPQQGDELFGDTLCAAFYNPLIHALVIETQVAYTYGVSGALQLLASGTAEVGVAYTPDGCYGCYRTLCYGGALDFAVSVAGCKGFLPEVDVFDAIEGPTCVVSFGATFPFVEVGLSGFWVQGPSDGCFPSCIPLDSDSEDCTLLGGGVCGTLGAGFNPISNAWLACDTTTNMVACNGSPGEGSSIEERDLFLTPDERPTCMNDLTFVACPDSNSISLMPLAFDPDGDPLDYSWSTDCPGASINDNTLKNPTLSFAPDPTCAWLSCGVSLTASGTWTDPATETTSSVDVSCTASVVNDTYAPRYSSFPADETLECVADTTVAANGEATAVDSCEHSIVSSDSSVPGCGNTETITRTWTAEDACGNSNSQDQVIIVEDNVPPTMDQPASDDLVECNGAGNAAELNEWLGLHGGAAASDVCSLTWSHSPAALSDRCGETGSATVTFTATDGCTTPPTTTATFTIEDTASPTVTCPENISLTSSPGQCEAWVSFTVDGADVCDSTPVVTCVDQSGASVSPSGDTFPVGITTLTCAATDECGHTGADDSFELEVNDPPQVTSVSPASQIVQYSDKIVPVTITATDCGPGPLTVSATGVPNGLGLPAAGSCGPTGSGVECTFTLQGTVLVPEGDYDVVVTIWDEKALASITTSTITVQVKAENATIAFASGNPVAVQVATDGGDSGSFSLSVNVQELNPELLTAGGNLPGDIGLAVMSMTLAPVGPGGPAVGTCTPDNDPSAFVYTGVLTVTCAFDNVGVNTYTVEAVLVANGAGELFYTGSNEDVLVVFDPSLGFTTGGGHIAWPGTGDRTNFGYTMKYNKKRTRIHGSLLLIRHLPDGSNYRVKSNALFGLAIGDEGGFGWASFAGKCTYRDPSMVDPVGNHEFVTYVEDHGEPGAGMDRFWLQVFDKDDLLIPDLSIAETAVGNAETIVGGNIVVPHKDRRGGRR